MHANTSGENMEIREMFDLKERNYPWEPFKYQMPKHYSSLTKYSQVPAGAMFGTKDNYLDSIQKAKKTIPGPTHYKVTPVTARPKSGKMDKAERKTCSAECESECKNKNPGPGSYFKRPKSAASTITGMSGRDKEPIPKGHYLNEV